MNKCLLTKCALYNKVPKKSYNLTHFYYCSHYKSLTAELHQYNQL